MTALAIIAGVFAYAAFVAGVLVLMHRVKRLRSHDAGVEHLGIGGAAERDAEQDHRGQGLPHDRRIAR